jgi:hypothetical protein
MGSNELLEQYLVDINDNLTANPLPQATNRRLATQCRTLIWHIGAALNGAESMARCLVGMRRIPQPTQPA